MKILAILLLLLTVGLTGAAGAEEVVYAKVGDTVTLRSPSNENMNYAIWDYEKHEGELARNNPYSGWKITPGEQWKNRLSLSGISLIIKSIREEDFGTFTLSKPPQRAGPTETVQTYKLSKVVVSLSSTSPLLPGESLSVACVADTPRGHKTPEIYWLNPKGTKLDKNGGVREGKLTVSATRQDNGRWTCVLKMDDNKESRVTMFVSVLDLLPAPARTQYSSAISPLSIPCWIPPHISWDQVKAKGIQGVHWHFLPKRLHSDRMSGDPQSLYSLSLEDPLKWKAEQGRDLRAVPDLNKGNLSLIRKHGREGDRGDYMCTLRFKNRVTLNTTVRVEVLQIVSSLGSEITSGARVNLSCSLGHSLPPNLLLKWIPPEQSSLQHLRSDHHLAHLVNLEVGKEDSGKWRCELWQNDTLLTSAVITLKIEPKLGTWMLVTICGATVIVVLLLILGVIFYQRRQRRMRHPRHRFCQCKNPKPKGFYRT